MIVIVAAVCTLPLYPVCIGMLHSSMRSPVGNKNVVKMNMGDNMR